MPKGEKKRKLTSEQRFEIIQMYTIPNPNGTWNGVILIARRFGVRHFTIQRILENAGVQMRSAKQAFENGKRTKPITRIPQTTPPVCRCGCGQAVEWNQTKNRWFAYFKGHSNLPAPYKTKEWLHQEYVVKGRTTYDIAREFGINRATVTRHLRLAGIQVRSQRDSLRLSGGVAKGNNPAWKGGITPERQRLYKTHQWKALIKEIYKRDNYQCQRCGTYKIKGVRFHAHHIKSWADYPQLRFEPTNLITLCNTCHTWVHSKQNVTRAFLS